MKTRITTTMIGLLLIHFQANAQVTLAEGISSIEDNIKVATENQAMVDEKIKVVNENLAALGKSLGEMNAKAGEIKSQNNLIKNQLSGIDKKNADYKKAYANEDKLVTQEQKQIADLEAKIEKLKGNIETRNQNKKIISQYLDESQKAMQDWNAKFAESNQAMKEAQTQINGVNASITDQKKKKARFEAEQKTWISERDKNDRLLKSVKTIADTR